uniref:Uncharacterized protein n=1 Tax=Ditylenchus dipsaci TaxID=166011 RepID=A0A915DI00_9BILA
MEKGKKDHEEKLDKKNEEVLSQGMTYSLRWAKLEEYVRQKTVCHILCLAMVLVIDENTNKATDDDEFDKKLKSLPELPKMPRLKRYSDAYKTKAKN